MKNLKITTKRMLLAMVIVAIGFTSCKKYLSPEPLSSFDNSLVFGNSVFFAKSAVIGAYNNLAGDYGYGIRISMYYPYDSDEMMGAGGTTDDGERRNIARYYLFSSNTQLAPVYNQSYSGIERSNICIDNIPKMALYTTGTTQVKGELRRLYGEALTLRAQYYFELVRNFGDVPEQRVPSAQLPNLFLPKTDRDTIYNHILADLLQAESLLPWRTEVASLGDQPDERITKGTAKGLRARIAMFRGGYSLRRASGIMERRADYKTYYQIALQECQELMARRDQHTLNPSYKSVWKDYVCGHNANDPSGELMFQVAMGGQTASTDSKLGTYNGTKFGTVGGGALTILPTYFYMFDSTDVRRDVVAVPYETNTDLVTRKGHAINAIVDGKWRKEWLSNPAFTPGSSAANLGLNWVIQRFSDILLMYAEADNELNNGPSASDIAAVKEVSQRGHGGNAALVPTIPTDKDGFFKFIVRERMLEFGSEAVRKYDLIRWNLLTAAINETKANLANMGTATPIAITPPSYMAPPPAYCLVNTLPKFMYSINTSTADDSKIFLNSLYKPAPTATPTGTTKLNWLGASAINSTFTTVFAYAYKPNHSELLPLANATLSANSALTQDYGY
ncbi:RagB/SusD family nutrient uptake outer membrane protein [Mucilaginibacter boryungensis]|nr:RagB/SusD family nutrient uptake outer membrane protein [Mucilaginibacter boryungensis]